MSHLTQKYGPIDVDDTSIAIIKDAIPQTCPTLCAQQLEHPNTYDEIRMALQAGVHHKAPGIHGLSLECYTSNCDTTKEDLRDLLNQMFLHKQVTLRQKHGIVVCLQKSHDSNTLNGYLPITLLTTECILLARIMPRRLRPILEEDYLRRSQYCAVPGNSIFDAVVTVRDAITYFETSRTPQCMLTLEFESVFDRISHLYMFDILGRYGISPWSIERIHTL